MDPSLEAETLSAFLQDTPERAHVIVMLGDLSMDGALERCLYAAKQSGERLVRDGEPGSGLVFVNASSEDLKAVVARARSEGADGVLLVIDAARSAASASAERHLAAERLHEHPQVDGLRLICIYERRFADGLDAGTLIRAACLHDQALTPEGP